MGAPFPEIRFQGELRPSQKEIVKIAKEQLAQGSSSLHIVAPPGSGKTILGLYLWAQCIRRPCLVLSPNSAIQSQWSARVDLFESPLSRQELVSTDPNQPGLLTSLTYQSLTMPARGNVEIEQQAIQLWCDKLIESGEVTNHDEAQIWIDELKTTNTSYFQDRLRSNYKKIREQLSRQGESLSLLHSSSRATLDRLADQKIGAVILDECHHLVGHWGRVLSAAQEMLGNPVVIGLTATPPDTDNKDPQDVERYQTFSGPIDYEVPVPAIVKDGYLAPYQDLAWMVRPTSEELKFVASADQRLDDLIQRLCRATHEAEETIGQESDTEERNGPKSLTDWLQETLKELRLPAGKAESWQAFEKRTPLFSMAARQFLQSENHSLPTGIPSLRYSSFAEVPQMEYWVPVLDRYVRHYLRRSSNPQMQRLGEEIVQSLRTLGIQITETGTRACSSPVSRVLAYSKNKAKAIVPILKCEIENLADTIRAVVVTDFERSSAVSAELKDLMDDEAGGAIAAFKTILTDEVTDSLEPILLTGSTILIDDEIEEAFLEASRQWLAQNQLKVELSSEVVADFRQIHGKGSDWSPRVYIELITSLFQQGLTKCLVGTRGLLGEGWDANKINVLIDLTTVTTSMSINQLRGRSFRLDPTWKAKLANNWDVVCIAPEFKKGFDDYRRFIKKHHSLFGVTDDGAIEKGVGHVHPAFTEIQPEGLESSMSVFNDEMLERSQRRDHSRGLWKIGEPYQSIPVRAVEIKQSDSEMGFPPFRSKSSEWTEQTLTRAISDAVIASLAEANLIRSPDVTVHDGELGGGYIRVFVKNATKDENELFAVSMLEVLGPLDQPRYVIERFVSRRKETLFSRILPEVIGRYFRKVAQELVMLHAVPSALAKNKQLVAIFEKHWNRFVSPGQTIFTQRGKGKETLEAERAKSESSGVKLHEKEVFL
jgi:superfamily II DNA or RNA helicase